MLTCSWIFNIYSQKFHMHHMSEAMVLVLLACMHQLHSCMPQRKSNGLP